MLLETIILERLLLALFLGGVIGYEREHAHKFAGLRTHILVCVGSALIAMVSIYGFTQFGGNSGDIASRIIANVIVGIGFIGGGTILRHESTIIGTTTAASLWVVAGVGIAVGIGFAYAAVATTLIAYIVLALLWRIERNISGSNHQGEKFNAKH